MTSLLLTVEYRALDIVGTQYMLMSFAATLGCFDAEAYFNLIYNASMGINIIAPLARDHSDEMAIPLNSVVHCFAPSPARYLSIDEGVIVVPSDLAHLNLIDSDATQGMSLHITDDFTVGECQPAQEVTGHRTANKYGVVIFQDDQPTGELPLQLLSGVLPSGPL